VITVLVGVLVVVAAVVLLLAASAKLASAATTVHVTGIDLASSDNACGTNDTTAGGFSAPTGTVASYTLTITNDNTTDCTIFTVSAVTAGFGISGLDTPLLIQSESTGNLTFTLHVPSTAYSGNLTLNVE
jgi:hypothetical protein